MKAIWYVGWSAGPCGFTHLSLLVQNRGAKLLYFSRLSLHLLDQADFVLLQLLPDVCMIPTLFEHVDQYPSSSERSAGSHRPQFDCVSVVTLGPLSLQ